MSVAAWLTYAANNCTQFVAKQFSWIPPFLGDAGNWLKSAPGKGIQTSNVAAPGEVAVLGADKIGGVGHVGIVQSINSDGSVVLHDQNWDLKGTVMTHTVPASLITGYLVPPGGVAPGSATGPIAIPQLPGLASFFTSVGVAPGDFLIRAGFIILGIILVAVGLVVLFKQERTIAEIGATAALA